MTTDLTEDERALLQTLTDASNKSNFLEPLALYYVYRAAHMPTFVSLQKKGLWFVLSSTQGNITEAGVLALKGS